MSDEKGTQDPSSDDAALYKQDKALRAAMGMPQLNIISAVDLEAAKKAIDKELQKEYSYVESLRELIKTAIAKEIVQSSTPSSSAKKETLNSVVDELDATLLNINAINAYQKEIFIGKIALAQLTPTNVNPGVGPKIATDLDKVIRAVETIMRQVMQVEIAANAIVPQTKASIVRDKSMLEAVLKTLTTEIKKNLEAAQKNKPVRPAIQDKQDNEYQPPSPKMGGKRS